MNTAPHLLPEDRPEFERALDEALRAPLRGSAPEPAPFPSRPPASAKQLSSEQLRAMALSAVTAIAACAAAEYQRYVELRDATRDAAAREATGAAPAGNSAAPAAASGPASGSAPGPASGSASGQDPPAGRDSTGQGGRADHAEGGTVTEGTAVAEGAAVENGGHLAATVEAAEAAGAGLLAMASVLLPVLAGTAAVIFLLLGYLLHIASPEPAVAAPMRSVGWVFAALAAVSLVVGLVGLWIAALRNGSRSRQAARDAPRSGGDDEPRSPETELRAAREAWRDALLERGILPFLSEALADPKGAQRTPESYVPAPRHDAGSRGDAQPAEPARGERTPRLGYSGPEFSSRTATEEAEAEGGTESARPQYSSPDYSSPEYGGPDHKPE